MLTAILLLAAAASAHEIYPITPVRAKLRVEPGRTVVDIRSDSVFWIAEVIGGESLPASWPAEARGRVESYVNAHLRLSAGGAPWRGTLAQARHAQWPWESHERGELRLRLLYPESPKGSTLSGEAAFFKEYREELLEEEGALPPGQHYLTVLEVPGASPGRFELTPERPGFTLSADAARRGTWGMSWESLGAGLSTALRAASGWPAVLALALALGPEWPRRRRAAPLALALGAAAAFLKPVPPAAAWAAGLLAAAAAGGWLDRRGGLTAASAGAAALGAFWTSEAAPWLPGAPTPVLPAAAGWLGVLAGGALLLAAAGLAAAIERRRAAEDSLSHAAELFGRRRRLAATAVLLACGYGLAVSL